MRQLHFFYAINDKIVWGAIDPNNAADPLHSMWGAVEEIGAIRLGWGRNCGRLRGRFARVARRRVRLVWSWPAVQ